MGKETGSFWKLLLLIAPVLSGILFFLAFLFSGVLWWMSIVALIPLFFFLQSARTFWGAFLGAWITGLYLFGSSVLWYWNVLPLDWLGITEWKGLLYVALSFCIATVLLALPVGLWGIVTWKILGGKRRIPSLLILPPLAWIIFEYGRTWLYALLTYAPDIALGPHFTIGFLGYFLAYHPILLQAASVGKVYLLSFLVVGFNILFFILLTRVACLLLKRLALSVCLLGIVVASSFVPVPEQTEGESVVVAALHTDFSPSLVVSKNDRVSRQEIYHTLLAQVAAREPLADVVVFPEDSRFFSSAKSSAPEPPLPQRLKDAGTIIIDSGLTRNEQGVATQRLSYYQGRILLGAREKIFLAPQGEYIPVLFGAIVSFFGDSAGQLEHYRGYRSGKKDMTVGEGEAVVIGGLFCSELFSPLLYGELKKRGASLFVNVASHSLFHSSHLFYAYFQSVSKVRAVENRVPLIVASNASPSFAVNAYGRLVAESSWEEESALYAEIPLSQAAK